MSKFVPLMFIFFVALFVGCSKTEPMVNSNSNMKAANSNIAVPAGTPSTTPSSAKIGVPECDAYIAAYESCVRNKVPAAARAQFESALSQSRRTWQAAAASPQSRASLAQACKTAQVQARTSMKAYGCTF
ncbi:MAG: hypothetical protein ABR555_18050 [Pyrinomonadaceae bacterium]